MHLSNAFRYLSSDVLVFAEEGAIEVCTALGVALPEKLLFHWETIEQAEKELHFKAEYAPGRGVWGLALAWHLANEFDVIVPEEVSAATLAKAIERKFLETGRIDVRSWWTV